MSETIRLKRDARGVAVITLARSDKHNAMSVLMLKELEQAARMLARDEEVRVVILASEGPSFCAGADLAWMREQFGMERSARRAESARLASMLGALHALPQPLIARVQGNAFGGGIGLMSVCDAAFAAPHARFALSEVRLGIIPANIGPYVIARMGARNAGRIFMNGRMFAASEAISLGLLTDVSDDLDAAIEAEIAPYLTCAPGAVRASKRLLRDLAPPIPPEQIEAAIDALAERWESEEARSGIGAFLDKLPSPWARGAL